jgi:hypothetical protein
MRPNPSRWSRCPRSSGRFRRGPSVIVPSPFASVRRIPIGKTKWRWRMTARPRPHTGRRTGGAPPARRSGYLSVLLPPHSVHGYHTVLGATQPRCPHCSASGCVTPRTVRGSPGGSGERGLTGGAVLPYSVYSPRAGYPVPGSKGPRDHKDQTGRTSASGCARRIDKRVDTGSIRGSILDRYERSFWYTRRSGAVLFCNARISEGSEPLYPVYIVYGIYGIWLTRMRFKHCRGAFVGFLFVRGERPI